MSPACGHQCALLSSGALRSGSARSRFGRGLRRGKHLLDHRVQAPLQAGQALVLLLDLGNALLQFARGGLDALQRLVAVRKGAAALAQLLLDLRRRGLAPQLDLAGGVLEDHAQLGQQHALELLHEAGAGQPPGLHRAQVAAVAAFDQVQLLDEALQLRRAGQREGEAELGIQLVVAGAQHLLDLLGLGAGAGQRGAQPLAGGGKGLARAQVQRRRRHRRRASPPPRRAARRWTARPAPSATGAGAPRAAPTAARCSARSRPSRRPAAAAWPAPWHCSCRAGRAARASARRCGGVARPGGAWRPGAASAACRRWRAPAARAGAAAAPGPAPLPAPAGRCAPARRHRRLTRAASASRADSG